MARALYRKYRPCRLNDVVGQEQVTEVLANSLKQGRVSHAYLFIGPRGTGKTSVARIFAHEVNGFEYQIEDDYVDIIEIDGASNRGIDNIRELREKVAIAPTAGKYKVYIIDEVHMLTKEAFNALLKTLEEPPEHAIFIMATTDGYKVPVTITSRAQTYTFKLADESVMAGFLRRVADAEGIKIDDAALSMVAKRGGGSFRDSLSLLDQISTLSDDLITAEIVEKAMGLPEDKKVEKLLSSFSAGDTGGAVSEMRGLLAAGVKPEIIAEEIIRKIIEKPAGGLMGLLSKMTEVRAPFAEAKLLVALMENGANSGPVPAISDALPSAAKKPVFSAATERKIVAEATKKPVSNDVAPAKTEAVKKPEIKPYDGDFNWEKYLKTVKNMNDATATQLKKCMHEVRGDELHLFPDKKITRTILDRGNNKQVLVEAGGGRKIILREFGEKPEGVEKDKLLSRISDIMGGEVRNVGGENPF